MRFTIIPTMLTILALGLMGADSCDSRSTTESRDSKIVQRQQSQYAIGQPIPAFDWSLERHLVIELYKVRNSKAATHSVWRSDRGLVEGDCPSYGYGIPYDTSLTNPLVATDIDLREKSTPIRAVLLHPLSRQSRMAYLLARTQLRLG